MKVPKVNERNINRILKSGPIIASAPCRVDMGGTLDISTFYYPLRHLAPCTFNAAIDLRTEVKLFPYKKGIVKISSQGFKSAEYPLDRVPFSHPLGLMFAVAAYFRASGVHIDIHSTSPPRSALGGSSVAAAALIAAFTAISRLKGEKPVSARETAILAHAIEENVAGVPCGIQDQLAAVYGGVNAWYWPGSIRDSRFRKKTIIQKRAHHQFEKHMALAYCGIPHASKNINGQWVKQFLSGKYREEWVKIVDCCKKFIEALSVLNYKEASELMNRELAIRRKMTPEVLDSMGKKLVNSAARHSCGARFTGAGGGGCIWAVGESTDITDLKEVWRRILSKRKGARLLDVNIAHEGIRVEKKNMIRDK